MDIEEQVSLKEFTTFKLGGPAYFFIRAVSIEEVREGISFARGKSLPFTVIGGGSNIIVRDEGYPGVVIKIDVPGISYKEYDTHIEATVGAGTLWDTFVADVVSRGYSGLENLSGIPGTVGATPVQNVGAYGVEVSESILWVEVLDSSSVKQKKFSNRDCLFRYRDSIFKTKVGKGLIITRVCYRLNISSTSNISYKDLQNYFDKRDVTKPTIREVRDAVISVRSGKFPDITTNGTAGSFFKNPIVKREKYTLLLQQYPNMPSHMQENNMVKIPLAWILDNVCNVKGFSQGHFRTYDKQPLVIVHDGGGTVKELLAFTNSIEKKVYDKTNIVLEKEVTLL